LSIKIDNGNISKLSYGLNNKFLQRQMKKNIHPQYFKLAKIVCSCGNIIETGSTKPEIKVEVCSACHPFYTGKKKIIDTTGQVGKFEQRLEKTVKMKAAKKSVKKKKAKAEKTNKSFEKKKAPLRVDKPSSKPKIFAKKAAVKIAKKTSKKLSTK